MRSERIAFAIAALFFRVTAFGAPALDATACPTGVPVLGTLDFLVQSSVVSASFSTTTGGRTIFAIGYISSSGSAQTLTAPATIDWSDASGNTVSPPAGASAWTFLVRGTWGAPYALSGDAPVYYATASAAISGARVKLQGATPSTVNNTRKAMIGVYPYYSTVGGTIAPGGSGSLVNLLDPPAPQQPLRVTFTVQRAGSQIVVLAWNDNSATPLVGVTALASEPAYNTTHGTLVDASHQTVTTDAIIIGRLATSNAGTVVTTTGTGNITVGASTSDNYVDTVGFEVMEIADGSGGMRGM